MPYGCKPSAIVTYVHHYKRPPPKKPPKPAIAKAVVTARRTDAKAKAAPAAKKSAVVTSISRKEAEFLRHARGATHDVEARDEDTDAALTARYRALMASKPQRKSSMPEEQQRRVDAAAALFGDVVRRTKARAKKKT